MKYGIFKVLFYYSDQWYEHSDELSDEIETYDNLEEAKKRKRALDIESLKKMNSYDLLRDLNGFIYGKDNAQQIRDSVLTYIKSLEAWKRVLKTNRPEGRTTDYQKIQIPKNATEEQLGKILDLVKPKFHEIIELERKKTNFMIGINTIYWEEDTFYEHPIEGLEYYAPFIQGNHVITFFLESKFTNTFYHKSEEDAKREMIYIIASILKQQINSSYLSTTSIEDLSDSPLIFKNYLEQCESFSSKQLENGQQILTVTENKEVNAHELKGLIDLLKIKPYLVFKLNSIDDKRGIFEENYTLFGF